MSSNNFQVTDPPAPW